MCDKLFFEHVYAIISSMSINNTEEGLSALVEELSSNQRSLGRPLKLSEAKGRIMVKLGATVQESQAILSKLEATGKLSLYNETVNIIV